MQRPELDFWGVHSRSTLQSNSDRFHLSYSGRTAQTVSSLQLWILAKRLIKQGVRIEGNEKQRWWKKKKYTVRGYHQSCYEASDSMQATRVPRRKVEAWFISKNMSRGVPR